MKNYLKNETKDEIELLSPKLDVVFQALFGEVGSKKRQNKGENSILLGKRICKAVKKWKKI